MPNSESMVTGDSMERSNHVDVMPVVLMALLALCIGFMPLPWDPDLWFHLADGNYILSHHSIPQTDPFSFTRLGQLWVPHSWLFDVAASIVWGHLGPRTAEAFMAVVFMAAIMVSFALLVGRGVAPLKAMGIGLALAIMAGNTRGIRPQVISLLLCNIVILLLVRHRYRPSWKLLVWLPAVFLIWSQVHGAVVLGLVVVGVWLLGRVMEVLTSGGLRSVDRQQKKEFMTLGAVSALAAGVIFITPHKISLYSYSILTMRLHALAYTSEWQAPRLWPLELPDVYLYVLIAAVAVLLVRKWRRIGWAETLLCLSLIGLGLTGVRHIPLACIGAVPLVAGALAADDRYVERRIVGTGRWPIVAGSVALVLLAALWWYPQRIDQRYASREPVRGVAALGHLGRPMRVFTTHNTGSYVLFASPQVLRVFIDSRPDVYGDAIFQQALSAMTGQGWQNLFDRWQIEAAVLQRQDELAKTLSKRPDWRLVAEDPSDLTFIRTETATTTATATTLLSAD